MTYDQTDPETLRLDNSCGIHIYKAIRLLNLQVDLMNSLLPPRPPVHFFKEIPWTGTSYQ
jgi:hypothetical protein